MIKVLIENEYHDLGKAPKPTPQEQRNEHIKKVINSYPIVKDQSVFKKTKEEKEALKKAKSAFKVK